MRIEFAAAVAAVGIMFASIAVGQDTAIPARQELMKENGAAAKAASEMVKGNTPYNATEAADAMNIIADNMAEFPGLFPPGSEQGGDTEASPKIWEDMAGFEAATQKMATAAKAAQEAAAGGLDSFKTAFAEVGAACSGCHKAFRVQN
jgi:cytochrome c556